MSNNLTYSQVRVPCSKVLNLTSTDTRVLDYVNRACERLLYQGKWKDTTVRYAVCVNEACLVWPREIETIEAVAVCGRPITPRNFWYEFLDAGPGIVDPNNCLCDELIDEGTVIAFDQVTGSNSKLAVYCDGTETGRILIRYYDSNAQKVYTVDAGTTIEGEWITFGAAGSYVYSTYLIMPRGWYAVIKPVTNRVVRVYEYDTVATTYKPLAFYEPTETRPQYRFSYLPMLNSGACNVTNGSDCAKTTVTIRAKVRFIPATGDDSFLVIGHADAIRLACQAIKKEEDNLLQEAALYWAQAKMCLQDQLHHFNGDGVVAPIRLENYAPALPNLI